MKLQVPPHFSDVEAHLAAQLLEILIDVLIDFHTALLVRYDLPD